jgi:hypothetical protein
VRDTYTFGDDDVAARRLDLLAQVYEPPTRAQRPAEMAALHVLNLRTWRYDPLAGGFDADELDALDDALAAIARRGPAEPVEQELGELVATAH